MSKTKLYTCENTVGTSTKYAKGTTTVSDTDEGICKGQAVAWCQNMLTGAQPKLTKPHYEKAAALQVLYERKSDGGSAGLFGKANLSVAGTVQGNGHALLNSIVSTPGVYQVRYDGHALGAANVGGKYYFFDSEQGLFELNSALDFTVQFLDGYESAKYREAWRLT
ncbi:MAG TPA: hypothetical protein VMM18_06445 [Gemmatimonadaceae bacterium]|nr:hypothetical protein [Gemmatimonadaceae bacterium]